VAFIRFSKDRRGYESTYLLHAARGGDREGALLLYWFRTPPFVKVGRAALDEDTIRLIEDLHPHMNFDWPRILASRPLPTEPPEPARPPRARRRDERPEPRVPRAAPRSLAHVGSSSPVPPAPVEERVEPGASAEPDAAVPTPEIAVPESSGRKFIRVFDAPSEAAAVEDSGEAVPGRLSEPSASERALGIEQLQRLQGRYAAAMARIARRISDPDLVERLRGIAERANPDAWVTADEVTAGLAGLDQVYAELASHVGHRRRRRRGGRRHLPRTTGAADPSESSQERAEAADDDLDADDSDADDGLDESE